VDNALPGDVLVCMGAGSIGAVPGKIVELLQKTELAVQEGRGL
jgi:UDP-N-acetylmuramate--alanine ligase